MVTPRGLSIPPGRILLLSSAGSFTATYLRRTLELFHVPVVQPSGEPQQAFAALTEEDWSSIVGCIAADVGPAVFADINRSARHIPCLFVGYGGGGWFPGPYAWMNPPFASYQIIEVLTRMISDSTEMP